MMRRDVLLAHALAQLMTQPLRHAPRVDEHQRGAVLLNQSDEPVVDLVPQFIGSDRSQWLGWYFDSEIELALVSPPETSR